MIRNVVEEGVLGGPRSASTASASASTTARTSPSRRRSRSWRPSPAGHKHIRLGTAVTVLSSDDPVRVFERFATLDAISGGRAEMTLGRGSFTESFPLFGYDLADYERLFSEKLDLMSHLLSEEAGDLGGDHARGAERAAGVPEDRNGRASRPGSASAVARSRSCARRSTASRWCWRSLAATGADCAVSSTCTTGRSRILATRAADRRSTRRASSPPPTRRREEVLWPHYHDIITRIGRERGWPPLTRERFDAEIAHGALYVGSPATVAAKIARTVAVLKADRFDLKYSNGTLPHELLMRNIELYGREVIPRVRELLAAEPLAA